LYLSAYLNKYGVDCQFIDFSAILLPTDDINFEDFIVDQLVANFPHLLAYLDLIVSQATNFRGLSAWPKE